MKPRAVILGSNSFAGSWVVGELLSNDYEVLGLSRSPQVVDLFKPYHDNPRIDNFYFKKLHVVQDNKSVLQAIDDFAPDVVIDFAGQGMVAESWMRPDKWFETNVLAKIKLHNHLKDKSYLKKYIRISTPEVYGDTPNSILETTNYNPSTPYAVSHAAIDMSLKTFYNNYRFPVIIARFSNFFGPYQQLYRIIPKTILSALSGKTLALHGGGTSVRSFIFGSDVASAVTKIINSGNAGEIYHFSSPEFISIKDLVFHISGLLDVDPTSYLIVGPERPGKDHAYKMDSTKSLVDLGWNPTVTLTDGIKETIRWVHEHYTDLSAMSWEYSYQD